MRIRLSDYEEILKALGEGLELALEIVINLFVLKKLNFRSIDLRSTVFDFYNNTNLFFSTSLIFKSYN